MFADRLLSLGFVTEDQLARAYAHAPSRADLGDALLTLGYCTRDQLHTALSTGAEAQTLDTPRLGEVLMALDYLTDVELVAALSAQASDPRPLGALLVDRGACTFEQVYEGLVMQRHAATKHAKVAVVDDSAIVRRVLTRGLVDLGYDVVSFEEPRQLLDQLGRIDADVVVTDLEMPGMDGAELCRRVKLATGNQLPVIILTGNASVEAASGLRAGADDYVRKGTTIEELSARIDGILHRAAAATRVRELFARYTSEAVVERVLQAGGVVLDGEKRDVTVLFADIRDFTSFSERNEPEYVVSTLNRILGKLADAVIAHGGTVDKFLGDGLMAVFGAPMWQGDHVERALAVGHTMLAVMSPEFLRIGIAINSGPVVVGSIGNERRTEYTCIGDVVNVCSRLCAIAQPGELLVGQGTYERARKPEHLEPLEPVKLKGKTAPVPLYRAQRPSAD